MSDDPQHVVYDCNVFVQALINRLGPAGRCVNLAVATRSDLIVSRDRDLLDLMDPARREAVEFHQRFPSLRIIDPLQFIHERETHR